MRPIPLAVRVVTSRQDIHITRRLADLTFRTVVPGGFASARFTVHGSLRFEPDEIAAFARVYIYDARNGSTVWEGRLEDPGRSVGGNGELFEIAALGPSTHVRDRTAPLIYIDGRLSELIEATGSGRAYSVGNRESANVTTGALSISAGRGSVVTQLSLGAAVYNAVYAAGQDLGAIYVQWDGGFGPSGSTQIELRTAQDLGATSTLIQQNIDTAGGVLDARGGGVTTIPANHNRFLLVLRRPGATVNPVSDDDYWVEFYGMFVMGTRVDATGTAVTSYPGVSIYGHEVVADLLGRLLTEYDGANASVATTSWLIQQLAYPDGATAEKILADLMEIEPTYLWEALESNSAGKYRFNWRAWPTSVRYEAGVEDGFTSTGSTADLYNEVLVRYKDPLGQVRTVTRTQTVQVLTDAAKTRGGFLDLGDETATQDMAENAGDRFLAEHATAPASGRLTVARPILDTVSGRMVSPWEIRPGYLIRIRDLNPRPAVLDATTRDGSSVFKVISVDYNAGDATAQLELDTPAPSTARAIADGVIGLPSPKPRTNPIRRR